ncbi:MAG: hypothetical protein M3Q48_04070 [Actinomycetota bacterium]|nr:hypothetical protein [Actinomycetota bacterium]
MATLPDRPDLAQLRRQAKELHRAARSGDAEAARRLRNGAGGTTLAAAQLVVAREHGFSSWPSLRSAVETARSTAMSPLMADKARRKAVYGASHMLSFARDRGWDPGVVPVGAVFTSQIFITAHLASQPDSYRESPTLRPANGSVYLTTTGPPVAIACLGLGAPAPVALLEHLAALGVGSFIAIGPAPAISNDLRWGDCVVLDRALRDDGVSCHYLRPARYASADPSLTSHLQAGADAAGLGARCGSGWTVPTPYRTTAEELAAYRDEGVLVTDMVTAAVFAAASALSCRAASAVVATTPVDARGGGGQAAPAPRPPGRLTALLECAVAVLQDEAAA